MRLAIIIAAALAAVPAATAAQPAAAPAAPTVTIETAQPALDPGAEVVCRRTKETGSLVKAKKTCHTKSQWAYIDDQHQRISRQMVQDGTTRPSGQ